MDEDAIAKATDDRTNVKTGIGYGGVLHGHAGKDIDIVTEFSVRNTLLAHVDNVIFEAIDRGTTWAIGDAVAGSLRKPV